MANNSVGPPQPSTGTQAKPVNALLTGPDVHGMIGHVPPGAGFGSRPLTVNGVNGPKLGADGAIIK